MAQRLPLHFVCACPENYQPDAETVAFAREAGSIRPHVEVAYFPTMVISTAVMITAAPR